MSVISTEMRELYEINLVSGDFVIPTSRYATHVRPTKRSNIEETGVEAIDDGISVQLLKSLASACEKYCKGFVR
ncbi:hypothetical protein NC652_031064 [Populus alba x Populus x berolinensis]|nr:hypothetical protein NC652_031064 [Populus alba x Populus x berolinensis]